MMAKMMELRAELHKLEGFEMVDDQNLVVEAFCEILQNCHGRCLLEVKSFC